MGDLINVVLLGIIEGITEFLPISSTGHLLIAERWLGLRSDLFNIVIQAGAILAVCLIYRTRLYELATGWRDSETRAYLGKLTLAFLITAVLGLIAVKAGFSLPTELGPVAWALIIGGIWMIVAEQIAARKDTEGFITADDVASTVLAMVELPASANVLELTVMPTKQPFRGRG